MNPCRECGGEMRPSKVIQNIWTSGGMRGRPAGMHECIGPSTDFIYADASKCRECGWTVSTLDPVRLRRDKQGRVSLETTNGDRIVPRRENVGRG